MFISGGEVLSSKGTTQDDPLSMAMYALAITPLIRRLNEVQDVSQVWFADDATAAASCYISDHGGVSFPPSDRSTVTILMPPRHFSL